MTTYIFDFDSTLVDCESLDELARLSLAENPERDEVLSELMDITRAGMAGELPFDVSLQRRLPLFRANRTHVDALTAWLMDHISPSIWEQREWFVENASRIYVVSGGFRDYIVPVVARLGIATDHVLANEFVYDDAGWIKGCDVTLPTSKAGGKIAAVRSLSLTRPVVMIGDGYTDYEVKQAGEADEFWAYAAHVERPSVVAVADTLLHSFVIRGENR
jgi:D-3-phosphoglycerate dehydrogenase